MKRGRYIKAPPVVNEALDIGKLHAVIYRSSRDGNLYRHDFKASSRPLLAASVDGETLILIGGSYRFTKRGIVDV